MTRSGKWLRQHDERPTRPPPVCAAEPAGRRGRHRGLAMVPAGRATARVDPAPLAIASVVDQVYAALRDRIIQGSLQRGARIHQEDLADELGVSRTPVREALRRLAAEGLVEMRTNRGARVADIGPSDMRGAYDARAVIEPGAA